MIFTTVAFIPLLVVYITLWFSIIVFRVPIPTPSTALLSLGRHTARNQSATHLSVLSSHLSLSLPRRSPQPITRCSGVPQPRPAPDSPPAVAPPEVHHRNTRSRRIFYPYLTPQLQVCCFKRWWSPVLLQAAVIVVAKGKRGLEMDDEGRQGLCRPVRKNLHRRET